MLLNGVFAGKGVDVYDRCLDVLIICLCLCFVKDCCWFILMVLIMWYNRTIYNIGHVKSWRLFACVGFSLRRRSRAGILGIVA